ncbi:MAG: GNAT family N-acetyltransferase, partial [Hyphomicrobiaceae bacterium]
GLGRLGLKKIVAIVDPNNMASILVVTKIGMQFERKVTFEGYAYPDHLFALCTEQCLGATCPEAKP